MTTSIAKTEADTFQRGAKLRQILVTAKLFSIIFFLISLFLIKRMHFSPIFSCTLIKKSFKSA